MNISDKERAERHFQRLITLVKEAGFSKGEIKVDKSCHQIEISRPGKPRNPGVILVPTREFMEDESDHFDSIVQEGIQIARKILRNPPSPHFILQGYIRIGHSGIRFDNPNQSN